MPKTLEEITKALEGLEEGTEFVAGIKSLADEIGKKNREAQNLRTRLKTAEESIESVNGKFSKVAQFIGLEDEIEDIEAALEALKNKKEEGKGAEGQDGKKSPEVAELTSQLNQLKRDLKKISDDKSTFEKVASEEKIKRQSVLRDLALQKALVAGKAVKPDRLAKVLVGNIKISDDDTMIFISDDGTEVTIDEGVKSFLTENPEFVINAQNPGAGGGGSNGGKQPDFNSMSQADYIKWRQQQQ